ncbi:MAG: hypothetical protein VX000_00170, partial [Myxococcota bacterium]|nr:hypothetical protein [Myxococcota bacterium]
AAAWQLCPGGAELRAAMPDGVRGLRLEGGALIERRGSRSCVARLVPDACRVDLPLGAVRGRVSVAGDAIAWADGPDLYRRGPDGIVRAVGQAPGPVTRLRCAPTGALVATVGDERSLIVPPTGRPRVIEDSGDAVLGGNGFLLQVGPDVRSVPWTADAEGRWFRNRELCGSPRAVFSPLESRIEDLSGQPMVDGVVPCAAAASATAVLGPAGRTWPLDGSAPSPADPALMAEHILAHEAHVTAVLDGHYRVRPPGDGFGPSRTLPAPFHDPDLLEAIRPARGGFVLVGGRERVFVSWAGEIRRGVLPRSRRAPAPPSGWHWNDAGLLLRLS